MSVAMPGLREDHVLQAVNFLQDPRVRREPLIRAVHFLRGKNVSDVEVREAFSRLKLPYPEGETAMTWSYPPPVPQRSGGSAFMGTMVTLGLTAGALYAAREFLRVYIIPRYFPEFIPITNVDVDGVAQQNVNINTDADAENNGVVSTHQHNALMKMQERQIESLKNTVEQLRQATCTTNERVERLSITLSTASQLAERRQQETAEIRDAIRQLSRTVSASNTPNTTTNNAYDRARSKDGSLAYTGAGTINSTAIAIDESQILLTPETSDKFKTPMMTAPNTQQREKAVPSTHIVDMPQVEDAFLSVAPAEIETHWGITNIDNDNNNSNKVSEKRVSMASDKVSSNTASISSSATAAVASAGKLETGTSRSEDPKREEMLNATRRLFQRSMKSTINTNGKNFPSLTDTVTSGNSTSNGNGNGNSNHSNIENVDDNISRRSTKSAPDPELPLTDDDDDIDDDF